MCLINAIEEFLSKFETYITLNCNSLNINVCKIYQKQVENLILELELQHIDVSVYQHRLKQLVKSIQVV